MTEWRIDIFIGGTHESRYFTSEKSAICAGYNAKKDGAKEVFLLRKIASTFDVYDIVKQF